MIKFWLYRILIYLTRLFVSIARVRLLSSAPVHHGGARMLFLNFEVLGVQLLDFVNLSDSTMEPDPFEGWFFAVNGMAFFNQAYGLQHICNIVKSPNLGLQFLLFLIFNFIRLLAKWYLLGSLFKTDHMLPSDEEMNELLTEDSQTFFFFVSFLFAAVLSGQLLFLFVRL